MIDLEYVKVKLISKEIGEVIRNARTKQELFQMDLPHKIKKNVRIVNTWESGKVVYDEKTANKFEETLKIKLN